MSTKAIQGKLWSGAPEHWAQHFEPWFLPLYKKALDLLELNLNHLLLDAGCGSGLFSKLAIKTGAEVIGVDAAPGLLEIAKRRNPKHNFLEEDPGLKLIYKTSAACPFIYASLTDAIKGFMGTGPAAAVMDNTDMVWGGCCRKSFCRRQGGGEPDR